jgi:hypothetical protein
VSGCFKQGDQQSIGGSDRFCRHRIAWCKIGDAPFAQLRDQRFSQFAHAVYDAAHDCNFRVLVEPYMLNIARARLANQGIACPAFVQPDEVASWLIALQAQDYSGALWSIGLRMAGATEAAVEQALAARTIVRTWPLRGTLHIVAAQDVRWLLALLTPRVIAQSAGRYRQLELDETTFARSKAVFAKALQGGKQLTRDELQQLLEQANIATTGQRGYHLLVRSAQDGLICFGSRRGKQQTFALLDEWTPPAPILARGEALAELARRYFTSHGPATLSDLVRWAGLTVADAKTGVELGGAHLCQETIAGQNYWFASAAPVQRESTPSLYLLPGFDEYLLGYADRSAVLDALDAAKVHPSANGVFQPTIAIDGRIAGTWKRSLKKSTVTIEVAPFRPLTDAEYASYSIAARRYGEFLELQVALSTPQ